MPPSSDVTAQPIFPHPWPHRRTLPIKRADAEPLSRADIQYDLLAAIFDDDHAVFTDWRSREGAAGSIPKKVSFCELYTSTIVSSPRCSKVLREKMTEIPAFAVDFAKIALLANVGRINTTMAFFPEMRTVLRSYHPIPSLQKTEGNLQDAPRIKNCLKACLLPREVPLPPTTPTEIIANGQAGTIPTTSVVNLIFALSNHSSHVSNAHFEPPFDFQDIFLPVNASSASRARAFLWLMFHYLESPSVQNPFADDFANQTPEKIPKLEILTPQQQELENVDTEEELEFGRRMAQYRSKFLQKQIADEEKEKHHVSGNRHTKNSFKFSMPHRPSLSILRTTYHTEAHENDDGRTRLMRSIPYRKFSRSPRRRELFPVGAERTMLEYAWHMAISTDPLLNSDEEPLEAKHVLVDYERRVHILSAKVRGKEVTPEPG